MSRPKAKQRTEQLKYNRRLYFNNIRQLYSRRHSSQCSTPSPCVSVLHRRPYRNNQFGMDVIDILVLKKHRRTSFERRRQVNDSSGQGYRYYNRQDHKHINVSQITTASLQQSSQVTNQEFKRSKLIAVILTMMWTHIYYGLVVMGSFLVVFADESNLKLLRLNLDPLKPSLTVNVRQSSLCT